jgi:hypothetical protein
VGSNGPLLQLSFVKQQQREIYVDVGVAQKLYFSLLNIFLFPSDKRPFYECSFDLNHHYLFANKKKPNLPYDRIFETY